MLSDEQTKKDEAVEPYTPTHVKPYQWREHTWFVYYTNYSGREQYVWVEGRDELAAFISASKLIKRNKRKADKRRAEKEQANCEGDNRS